MNPLRTHGNAGAERRGHGFARRGRGIAILLAAALVLVAGQFTGPQQRAEAQGDPDVRADTGAEVVDQTRVSERILDLTIDSPSLGDTGKVRLLLPRGWDEQPNRDWPTLWLLHGCCDEAEYKSWTEYTDVEQFMADKPALVVMPTDGAAGMYTDWWNFGLWDKPAWETFHTTEVKQIVERGYNGGGRRAVAGLSIGGFGAMHYAFRHPDMFDAAASYSGLLHTLEFTVPGWIKSILVREGFFNWTALWGGERFSAHIWRQHNPYDHVEELRGTELYVSGGNGDPGPLPDPINFDPIEPMSLQTSQAFVNKLRENDIPVTTDFYGAGTHSWPYWERALHRSWPVLKSGLGLS